MISWNSSEALKKLEKFREGKNGGRVMTLAGMLSLELIKQYTILTEGNTF
jgi:hypothetical protein